MTDRVDRTERLLNLVICLMDASIPVPRSSIRAAIPGYADSPSDVAFERMFERDKDELRSMGIPVETVSDASGEVLGYRIPKDSYALAPIDFTLDERAAIAVAAQVWSRASIAPVPGTALLKLETVDGGVREWGPAELAGSVEVTVSDAALLPLMSAIRQDRVVSFLYRTPAQSEAAMREVSPWGLRASSGRWFLVGWDHARDAVRTFRLSRITGPVAVAARQREQQPPPDFDITGADDAAEPEVTARVRLTPGRGAMVRRHAVEGQQGDTLDIRARSQAALVAMLCGAGADAVLTSPDSLIAEVTAGLQAVLEAQSEVGGAQ